MKEIKTILNTIKSLTEQINEEGFLLNKSARELNLKETKSCVKSMLLKFKKLKNELNFYSILNQNKKLNDLLDELQKNSLISIKLANLIKTQIESNDPIEKLNQINIKRVPGAGKKAREEFVKLINLLAINEPLSICK